MSFLKKTTLFFCIIFLLITSYFYRQKSVEFKFVDELDNFTFGKYLLHGEKLYDDLISNHQPLTFILSALVQDLTKPINVYYLLTHHREAVFIIAIIYSTIIVYYFGILAFLFVVIYELTKFYLLGNLFLAESIVVYPLLYLVGTSFFVKKLSNFQIFLWSLSFFSCVFLLGPILPAVLFLLIFQLLKERENLSVFLKPFIFGSILPIFLIIKSSSLIGYFYYYYFVNLTYTVPNYQKDSAFLVLLKSILTPILSFFSPLQSATLLITQLAALLFIISILTLFKTKKVIEGFSIIIFLGLLNLRFVPPGTESYSGFHLLPYYAAFIFITTMISTKNKTAFFIIIPVVIFFSFQTSGDLYAKNKLDSYEINYSTHIGVGDFIRATKKPQDKLFISPNAWLIYWVADIDHLPKLYGDYTWMAGYKPLRDRVINEFEKNPPRFFYCENCISLSLEKFLTKYKRVENSYLYMLVN